MVICLERGADLHMALLMPLPLTVSCSSKIQIGFTVLVPADLGGPGKGPLNVCVCVCVCVCACIPIGVVITVAGTRVNAAGSRYSTDTNESGASLAASGVTTCRIISGRPRTCVCCGISAGAA